MTAYVFFVPIIESLWRHCYGGWDSWIWRKLGIHKFHRQFWNLFNIIFVFSVCFFVRGIDVWWSAYFTLVFQFLFWQSSFGDYFDIGRNGIPKTREEIDDYNSPWYSFILNWLFREDKRYTDFYDYVAMMFRFSYPMLLLFFVPTFNIGLCLLGPIVASSYWIGWIMDEKDPSMEHHKLDAIDVGELGSGFFAGLFLSFL